MKTSVLNNSACDFFALFRKEFNVFSYRLFGGSIFGVATMCCFIVASQEDERLEKLDTNNAEH